MCVSTKASSDAVDNCVLNCKPCEINLKYSRIFIITHHFRSTKHEKNVAKAQVAIQEMRKIRI